MNRCFSLFSIAFCLSLFQIFLGNLEIVTSPLDFFTPCDKNRPWTNADKINLLALIKQAQSLYPGLSPSVQRPGGHTHLPDLYVLFQQNCTPCVCLDSEDAIMLFDLFLTGKISCRAILKQRVNPFAQPMPLPCAFLCQRQNTTSSRYPYSCISERPIMPSGRLSIFSSASTSGD